MEKRKAAIFTIVKNESFFLPIWINYYQKYFENQDIWVINHQSDDDSLKYLDGNINLINIKYDKVFDYEWILNTIKSTHADLLNLYNCVLFSEIDELIYSLKGLNITIDNFLSSADDYITCNSYEIIHSFDEPGLYNFDSIFDQRHYWYFYSNRTLLSKIPLDWDVNLNIIKNNIDDNLYSIHLKKIDYNISCERNTRTKDWIFDEKYYDVSYYNRIYNPLEIQNYINDHPPLEYIPQEHKDILKNYKN